MIKQIGPHQVRHGDVNDPELDGYIAGRTADIFYSDPPWGTGNLKYWNTMNKKMNPDINVPEARILEVDPFVDRILSLAVAHTHGWVAIEYGQQWNEKIKKMAAAKGLHYCSEVEGVYSGQKYPFDLIVFRTDGPREIDLTPLYHMTAYGFVKKAFELLKPVEGGLGMDLCCGMGYTAQACLDNGLTFVGNELNLHRLEKTIERLEKGVARAAA